MKAKCITLGNINIFVDFPFHKKASLYPSFRIGVHIYKMLFQTKNRFIVIAKEIN